MRERSARTPPHIDTRRLGRIGPEVSTVGLGAMGMSGAYGPAGALDIELDEQDLTALADAVPPDAVVGDRYPARGMATLDSERT